IFGVEPRDSATNSVQFLAVFPSRGGKAPSMMQVGARGLRFPRAMRSQADTIIVATKEYRSSDPMCCPSEPGELQFKLKDGALVLTTAPEPALGPQVPASPDTLSKEQISVVVRKH